MKQGRTRWTMADVRTTLKTQDAWSTVLIFDPVAVLLVYALANFTSVSPNLVSVASILAYVGSAILFWLGPGGAWVAGAVLAALGFLLDCVDGKLARLKKQQSRLGWWLDHGVCLVPLYGGMAGLAVRSPSSASGDLVLWLGIAVILLSAYTVIHKDVVGPLLQRHTNVQLDNSTQVIVSRRLMHWRLPILPTHVDAVQIVTIAGPLSGRMLECFAVGLGLLLVSAAKYALDRFLLARQNTKRDYGAEAVTPSGGSAKEESPG